METPSLISLVGVPILIVGIGALFYTPIDVNGKARLSPMTPARKAALAETRVRYEAASRAEIVADAFFREGRFAEARAAYERIPEESVVFTNVERKLQIGGTYVAEGRYADAIRTYRGIESLPQSYSVISDGTVKANLAFVAHLMKDEPFEARLVQEAWDQLLNKRDRAGNRPYVENAKAKTPTAIVYELFAYAFLPRRHRSGFDWAYTNAIAADPKSTELSYQYASALRSAFDDWDASLRVLLAAAPGPDARLNKSVRQEIERVRFRAANLRRRPDWAAEAVAREAKNEGLRDSVRFNGHVYDPADPLPAHARASQARP